MEDCLLNKLPYSEYQAALALPIEICEIIARLANLKIHLSQSGRPGKQLVHALDRAGFKVTQYRELLITALNTKIVKTYYKPQSKVAILIGNVRYLHLSRLATPSIDCESLGLCLKNLGFIVVTLTDIKSTVLKDVLEKIIELIPENSYCLVFYAGHGCQICNTMCILSIDCPPENIKEEHCVTENFVLNTVAKCKPELCVLIMDMCRVNLDRAENPEIYNSILSTPPLRMHSNYLIAYTTQSSASAYELVEIECSMTINNDVTYELKTGDTDRIVPNASQYVKALCTRLEDDLDVSSMLDKVHADVENSLKKQRPLKVQCGTEKRSFYDPVLGNTGVILHNLKEIGKDWETFYNVL